MNNSNVYHRAAIFDRDGTLIVDAEYTSDPESVELLPGARSLVHSLKEMGFIIGLATNQSGIGRGYFTETAFWEVTKRVEELLGIEFDSVEMCPHHPDDQCRCRKPLPYMLEKILRDHGCTQEGSFYAGDKRTDIEAGKSCGLKTFWCSFRSQKGDEQADDISDITVTSLEEILEYV